MAEIFKQGHKIYCKAPFIFWTDFEDNAGTLEISIFPRMRPRTKTLNLQLHHFWSLVKYGTIKLKEVHLAEQLADQLTKPLSEVKLWYLRKKPLGW